MEESESDLRMKLYQQQEEEFLHYANTFQRNQNKIKTEGDGDTDSPPCHGLQCLLALTKLLEDMVGQKSSPEAVAACNSSFSMEKDAITLCELRKHAEKLVRNFHPTIFPS